MASSNLYYLFLVVENEQDILSDMDYFFSISWDIPLSLLKYIKSSTGLGDFNTGHLLYLNVLLDLLSDQILSKETFIFPILNAQLILLSTYSFHLLSDELLTLLMNY